MRILVAYGTARPGTFGARGHVTFGGRLRPDATGFPANAMARKLSGDWRDPDQIRGWAASVAAQPRTSGVR